MTLAMQAPGGMLIKSKCCKILLLSILVIVNGIQYAKGVLL